MSNFPSQRTEGRLPRRFVISAIVLIAVTLIASIGLVVLITTQLMTDTQSARWTPANQDESREAGDRVIVALRKYRSAAGHLPESLDALIPVYFENVPHPTCGNPRWDYQRTSDQEFTLVFSANKRGSPRCEYASDRDSWVTTH